MFSNAGTHHTRIVDLEPSSLFTFLCPWQSWLSFICLRISCICALVKPLKRRLCRNSVRPDMVKYVYPWLSVHGFPASISSGCIALILLVQNIRSSSLNSPVRVSSSGTSCFVDSAISLRSNVCHVFGFRIGGAICICSMHARWNNVWFCSCSEFSCTRSPWTVRKYRRGSDSWINRLPISSAVSASSPIP